MEMTAAELGQPILSWIAAYNRAALSPQEQMGSVEKLVERAFGLGQEAGEPDAVLIYGAQLSAVRVYDGRAEEVTPMLEQSVAAYPRIPAWRAGLAHTYCFVGRHSDAAAIVVQAAEDRFEHVPHDQNRTTALALYASAAGQAKVGEAAAILYDLIEPWGDQVVWNGATGLGHARMWLALLSAALGANERADEEFEFACQFQEAHGLPLWAAFSHLCWGEALAARGGADRAREEGARALELSRRYGYGAYEDRAAALAAGRSPARAAG
jgi:hypothetical protein